MARRVLLTGHDRHGSIAFKLSAGAQRADGDVLMIPDTFAWPYRGVPGEDPTDPGRPDMRSQLLAIQFVSAGRGQINGTMEPVLGSGSVVPRLRLVCRHRRR